MSIELDAKLRTLENKVDKLLTQRRGIPIALDNLSLSPTDAELDAAFGSATDLYNGFVGLVDVGGAGTSVFLCAVVADKWWYEQLTLAA